MSDASTASDDELLELLDGYLADLHSGKAPDRARLAGRDENLSSILKCLEALDKFAPPPPPPELGEFDPAVTLDASLDSLVGDRGAPSIDLSELSGEKSADFGRYEILCEIGRGGMGVVYKARQKDLERFVAIKMIQAHHLRDDAHVARFFDEAKAAGRLQHQHIVRIHDAGQFHGLPYFAMEYVSGASLAERIAKSPPDYETSAEWLAAVARAVAYLHGQGIVHRDLKPSNILLDEHDRPLVTDFGLAKMLARAEGAGDNAIAGTPSYMAPEQAAGRNQDVGPLADVYSLGAILYEMLTGRPPFREKNALDTLVQVLEGEAARPQTLRPDVPDILERICLKCLEKKPDRRYASAAALAEDLERYQRGEEIEARPTGLWPILRRFARRQPALASRLAGMALCAFVVQIKFLVVHDGVTLGYHLRVMGTLALWAITSSVFQWMLVRNRYPQAARFLWAAADAASVTSLLVLTGVPPGPLTIGYPLMIVASGLWFDQALVWFMTAASLAGYAALAYTQRDAGIPLHHHVLFAGFAVVVAVIVAFQVRRILALRNYYARNERNGAKGTAR